MIPEYTAATASAERSAAQHTTKAIQKLVENDPDEPEWTLAHSLLADMGGIAFRFVDDDDEDPPSTVEDGSSELRQCNITTTAAHKDGETHADVSHHETDTNSQTLEDGSAVGQRPGTTPSRNSSITLVESTNGNVCKDLPKTDEARDPPDDTEDGLETATRSDSAVDRMFKTSPEWEHLRQKLLIESDVVKRLASWEKPFGRTDWRVNKNNESCVRTVLRDKTLWVCSVKETIDSFARRKHRDPGTYMRNLDALRGNLWILNSRQIYALRSLMFITRLPQISKPSIDTMSKSDVMSKMLTISQLLWLILQIITRAAAKLPITQLEIATVAFAASSILTYSYYWSKPQSVKAPIVIEVKRKAWPDLVAYVAAYGLFKDQGQYEIGSCWNSFKITTSMREPFFLGALANATCFGVIHCTAWNCDFPTQVEKTLWRVISIATAVWPWIVHWYIGHNRRNPFIRDLLARIPSQFLTVEADIEFGLGLYAILRAFVAVEIIRSLFYLPPGAYVATSLSNFPHLG